MSEPLVIEQKELSNIISAYIESEAHIIADRIVDQIILQGMAMNALNNEPNDGMELLIRFKIPSRDRCIDVITND